jgi:hypothetical protein
LRIPIHLPLAELESWAFQFVAGGGRIYINKTGGEELVDFSLFPHSWARLIFVRRAWSCGVLLRIAAVEPQGVHHGA